MGHCLSHRAGLFCIMSQSESDSEVTHKLEIEPASAGSKPRVLPIGPPSHACSGSLASQQLEPRIQQRSQFNYSSLVTYHYFIINYPATVIQKFTTCSITKCFPHLKNAGSCECITMRPYQSFIIL